MAEPPRNSPPTRLHLPTLARRAMALRCVLCGKDEPFTGIFSMRSNCRRCGYVYTRERGYFLGSAEMNFWVTFCFLVPMVLFAVPDTRNTLWGPTVGSLLLVAGVLSTRLNSAVFAMNVRHWETYFPSMGEFATSLGVLAAGILVYMWLIRVLPVHAEEPLDEPGQSEVAGLGRAPAVS